MFDSFLKSLILSKHIFTREKSYFHRFQHLFSILAHRGKVFSSKANITQHLFYSEVRTSLFLITEIQAVSPKYISIEHCPPPTNTTPPPHIPLFDAILFSFLSCCAFSDKSGAQLSKKLFKKEKYFQSKKNTFWAKLWLHEKN